MLLYIRGVLSLTFLLDRLESRSKAKYLKNTIQDLRRKYAGSVPLPQQEKFHQSVAKIAEGKTEMEEDLRKVRNI